jgi:predicted acyltransferase
MSRGVAKSRNDVPILSNPQSLAPPRLLSLDALRGFDMFWIIGGEELIRALANLSGNATFHELAYKHTEHPEWHGFALYDCIFPLFMFIAGVAIPYSFASHLARGQGSAALHLRVIRRGILLILLGLVINGILAFNFSIHFDQDVSGIKHLVTDFSHVRFPSVLGRIGIGYTFAALIVLHTRPRNQLLTAMGLLIGYWAALRFIPVPGFDTGGLLPGQNLGDYIDRHVLPGHLYRTIRDPEGLFSAIPSIATVLFGVMAGHWLRRTDFNGLVKAAGLAVAGVLFVAAALTWDKSFPINKNLWSSSFVLMTSGISLFLLSLFYLVIDVWQFQAWSFFFVVIGMNAITVYVGQKVINFDELSKLVFSHHMHGILLEAGPLMLKWIVLFVLYKMRIFLRV